MSVRVTPVRVSAGPVGRDPKQLANKLSLNAKSYDEICGQNQIMLYRAGNLSFPHSRDEVIWLSLQTSTCGIPIIVSGVTGNTQMIERTGAERFTEAEEIPDSGENFSDVLKENMGKGSPGGESAQETFDWSRVINHYLELHSRVRQ